MWINRLHRRLEMACYDRRKLSRAIACFCQSLQDVCRILNEEDGKKRPPKRCKKKR